MGANKIAGRMLSDDTKLKIKKLLAIKQNRRMLQWKKQTEPYCRERYPIGINLIGDISAETGLGQSVRILASIMEKSSIPFCVKQINSHGVLTHNDEAWAKKVEASVKYAVNLIHIIPGTWAKDYCGLEKEVLDKRYNIAYWLWELEEFPDYWLPCIQTVDEIWTPSEFISNALRRRTKKPVVTVPYAIDMESRRGKETDIEGYFQRKYFGLPEEKFLFLTMYDFISVSERKNPQAVIEAYVSAFQKEKKDAGLVIKVNHVEEKKLAQLKEKLKEYQNIYFITENMTRKEVDSLMNAADVLVSLHRSEGFGLPVAEAMALGKPVISTNWSATAEFTDEECACPVDYKLVQIRKTAGPYEKGNYWAEADVEHAAQYMRRLWEDREYAHRIGTNAKNYMDGHLTYEYAADIIKDRLKAINGQGK